MAAVWNAVSEELPNAIHRGCAFHWSQAIWRHIQTSGLQPAYVARNDAYKFLRKVLALPFLPAAKIKPMFAELEQKCNDTKVEKVLQYVKSTWIDSTLWPPAAWSVFMQPIRTNNDVEGWHYRLNHKAKRASITFYLLLKLLHEESAVVQNEPPLVGRGQGATHAAQAVCESALQNRNVLAGIC